MRLSNTSDVAKKCHNEPKNEKEIFFIITNKKKCVKIKILDEITQKCSTKMSSVKLNFKTNFK